MNLRSAPTRGILLATFATSLLLPVPLQARDDQRDKPSTVVLGYLFGSMRGLDYKLYTHLCHAFITADENGHLKPNRLVPDPKLTAEAHRAGVKVLISLGGWGWDKQFAAIVAKPEAEERYVKAVIAMVKANDYDGLDVDWEYPNTKEEITGFEHLCRRLRKELDAIGQKSGRKMLLTMAAPANPGTLRWLQKEFLLENMNWINIMTYDMAGSWSDQAGHHSPLFASSKLKARKRSSADVINYLINDRGIPASHLALGIPLYGRGFSVGEPYAPSKGTPRLAVGEASYSALERLRKEKGWTRQWDDETKNPWLIAPDHNGVIGYDDAESARLKTEWALKTQLRGIFYWQVAGDLMPDGSHPVQEAARTVWSTKKASQE